VDYSKTPEQHYPVQVEECYQAYKWVLKNATSECKSSLSITFVSFTNKILDGISLDKIIFAGDSAGGNLVLAVLIRVIHDELRVPDGLVLSYPATYLHFTPSPARIISLLDPLLNFKLLELCGMEYYLQGENMHVKNNAQRNPLISPAMAPDAYLRKFPRTYINAGSLDPLFDDAAYIAKRIEEVKGREFVKLEVYDSLGHGYLNLIDMVPESRIASNRICDFIKQIMNQL
jgi:hormone-sensitive lipase